MFITWFVLQVVTPTPASTQAAAMVVAPRVEQAQSVKSPSALETWRQHMKAKSSATTPALAFTPTPLAVHKVVDDDDEQARGGFKRPRYIIHSDSE